MEEHVATTKKEYQGRVIKHKKKKRKLKKISEAHDTVPWANGQAKTKSVSFTRRSCLWLVTEPNDAQKGDKIMRFGDFKCCERNLLNDGFERHHMGASIDGDGVWRERQRGEMGGSAWIG